MVLQFVGFMGGWNHPGALAPIVAATAGALLTTWTTFVPCFLWIFLGGPYIERLRGNLRLSAALSAIHSRGHGLESRRLVRNACALSERRGAFPTELPNDWKVGRKTNSSDPLSCPRR